MAEEPNGWKPLSTGQFAMAGVLVSGVVVVAGKLDSFGFSAVACLACVLFFALAFAHASLYVVHRRFSRIESHLRAQVDLLEGILAGHRLREAIDQKRWLMATEQVRSRELGAKVCENWTATPDFHYELVDFRDVVMQNLRMGLEPSGKKTRYSYIYPATPRAEAGLTDFRRTVVAAVLLPLGASQRSGAMVVLNSLVTLYPLMEDIIPLNEGIHNPTRPERIGFLMTPEPQLGYYIFVDGSKATALEIKFRQLMEMSRRERANAMPAFMTAELLDEAGSVPVSSA